MTDVESPVDDTEEPDADTWPEHAASAGEGEGLRFQAKKFVLETLFGRAAAVLPQKDILPVLKNFQVEASDDGVRIAATDLELSILCRANIVTVERPGRAVFPGKALLQILRTAQDDLVDVDVRDGVAHISVARANWTLRLMDGSEYPPFPPVENLAYVSVDRERFLTGLTRVSKAAGRDATRPNLQLIDCRHGFMQATDGVRCQRVQLGEDLPIDMQIPIGAVDNLVKLLRSTDAEHIQIAQSDFHLVFLVSGAFYVSAKLMMDFPNITDSLINPALTNTDQLLCARTDLAEAVARVRINADPETSAIKLTARENRLRIETRDKYGNAAFEEIDCGWQHADSREVVVNHNSLSDMLDMADQPTCHFFFGQDTRSRKTHVLLMDEDTNSLGIISQMRADWAMD